MGKIKITNKTRGTAYEYKTRDLWKEHGWDTRRNILSGGDKTINKITGTDEDVIAIKDKLVVDIQCKKTIGKNSISINREHLENLQFDKKTTKIEGKEYDRKTALQFTFGRCSTHYIIVTLDEYIDLLNKKENNNGK